MTHLSSLAHRVYATFIRPSRLGEYRELLCAAVDAGYTTQSVRSFHDLIRKGRGSRPPRLLILRHDVDSDVVGARLLWEVEALLGLQASYYFRLSTVDVGLMREIEARGSEASYHYEEVATVIKQMRLQTRQEAMQQVPSAADLFLRNLQGLRSQSGLPMLTVAFHGDFANRWLDIPSSALLDQPGAREAAGICADADDPALMSEVTLRCTDMLAAERWHPEPPGAAIARADPVIYLLTHPRHWHRAPWDNALLDARRFFEGIRLGSTRAPRRDGRL